MRRDWLSRSKDEPSPPESSGELERIPRTSGTATGILQVHLRVSLESKAAQNLRSALERDGKRVAGASEQGRLLTSFCVDTSELDLQRYTGTVRVCSCNAFES
jgi:hypothetical protein